jgi:hypothetical protein
MDRDHLGDVPPPLSLINDDGQLRSGQDCIRTKSLEDFNVQEGVTGAIQDLDEAEALVGFEPLHDRVHGRAPRWRALV